MAKTSVRCAIYTRKSTEHGLELEFNSLHAQREACEAFVKSQVGLSWAALPDRYDDGAYSGGSLDRPALQQLLKDIDDGRVDVVVVYKIDRLTRSLTDFARLVEIFDAKAISFVAVTQQFNTTTSMGRLTLNVLLSFAQFERELSSERVRDKIAASRRLGKWTGGTVPLGYRAEDKKLVPDPAEAKTVQYIFQRYMELGNFQSLIDDLDRRKITTKRRCAKLKKYQGGIPFTFGSLAYLLKNRMYIGEVRHRDQWFKGEHDPILEPKMFQHVQDRVRENAGTRRVTRAAADAPLTGKLFDDHGNRMSPSYTVKNGVRYRSYVSSAVLRGRKAEVGSVSRVPPSIERRVAEAIAEYTGRAGAVTEDDIRPMIESDIARVTVRPDRLDVTLSETAANGTAATLQIPWQKPSPSQMHWRNADMLAPGPDPAVLDAVVRAHAWVRHLCEHPDINITDFANTVGLHPRIVRRHLRLAYLDPELTEACLYGGQQRISIGELSDSDFLWEQQRASHSHANLA